MFEVTIKRRRWMLEILFWCGLAAICAPALAAPRLVPDGVLRAWDPVTVFFDEAVGPAQDGEVLEPAAVVNPGIVGPGTIGPGIVEAWPAHPGAFRWLDARTLQFRPVQPWPALKPLDFAVPGAAWRIQALLDIPTQTVPAQGAQDLGAIRSVTLTFAAAIDARTLAPQLQLVLTPLPATLAFAERRISGADLDIKVLDRHTRDAPVKVVITLPEPLAEGTQAELQLRLGAARNAPVWRYRFATAAPFRVTRVGCLNERLPVPAAGVLYGVEAVLRCRGQRGLVVEFSAPPRATAHAQVASFIHISPPVLNLQVKLADRLLVASGDFAAEQRYTLNLSGSTVLADSTDRRLHPIGPTRVVVTFPSQPPFLRWAASQGVVELHGPQHLPLLGRAEEQVDLKIFGVDPMDRGFWPFPGEPVSVREDTPPPGPGEAPVPFDEPSQHPDPARLAAHLRTLGTPLFSGIVSATAQARRQRCPLRVGFSAYFGEDARGWPPRDFSSGTTARSRKAGEKLDAGPGNRLGAQHRCGGGRIKSGGDLIG